MLEACKIITGIVVMYFAFSFFYLLTEIGFKKTMLDIFISVIVIAAILMSSYIVGSIIFYFIR
jgi:hypothetical protein